MNKQALFQHISDLLAEKISRMEANIADLQKDMAEDSKSSAGDKFETSREMAQQELVKLNTQLKEQQRLKHLADSQSAETLNQVQSGALIETNKGSFLVGIPVGNISFEGKELVGIGMGAPLGQLLLHKKKGDQVSFNNQQFLIQAVY
jgi:transcription elongation GreA/GreB family factor